DGVGVRAAVEQPLAFWNGRISGSVIGADRKFQNPFSSTITPGALLADGHVELPPRQPSRLRFGATGEDYSTSSVDAQRTTISAAWTETIANHVALTAGYDERWLDHNGTSSDSGLVTAGARVGVGSRFEAGVSREQNVRDDTDPTYPDQTLVGGRYKVGPQTSLFYTQRISDQAIVPVGDFTGTGFCWLSTTGELSFGVESRVTDATEITSRYQVDRGVNGPDAFALIGVVTQLSLGRGFAGTVGGDWGKSVAGTDQDYKSG